MGATIYYDYYPKKCNDADIIPYLNEYRNEEDINGKHLSEEFYEELRKNGKHYTGSNCYVLNNPIEFAGLQYCPDQISDYICENYNEHDCFIIWIR